MALQRQLQPLVMLKYATYDIVFQEFPDEVTLAIDLSLCPNRCPGCHSAALQGDIGEPLTQDSLAALIDKYADAITCVGLMGGDNDPEAVLTLLAWVRSHYQGRYHTGWYSGRTWQPDPERLVLSLSYLKLGPWVSALGPLGAPEGNQRYYRVEPDGSLTDQTARFAKKHR